jgi:hypothetical protein
MEGSFNLVLGPVYLGAGGGLGTYAIDVMDDRWSGLAMALHGQVGTRIPIGSRALVIEARGGHSLPMSSTIPNEPVPSGVVELALGVGIEL